MPLCTMMRMEEMVYSGVCSWCQVGERSLGITYEQKAQTPYTVSVSLCAKCFFKVISKVLGEPKNTTLGTVSNEPPGICH